MEDGILELFCRLNNIDAPDTLNDRIIVIEVGEVADVWIMEVSDEENSGPIVQNGEFVGEVELFAIIDGINADEPKVLRLLLEGNYLGIATGRARIGIDPFSGKIALCERWPAQRLLHANALADLAIFASNVAGWRKEGVTLVAEHIAQSRTPAIIEEMLVFRP